MTMTPYNAGNIFKYYPTERISFFDDFLIRFTQTEDLNDPAECLPKFKYFCDPGFKKERAQKTWERKFPDNKSESKRKHYCRQFIKTMNWKETIKSSYTKHLKMLGILSLSKSSLNGHLWENYAKDVFCIGFSSISPFFHFRDVRLGYMGFIQAAKLLPDKLFSRHVYYIPKTKPFQFKGRKYDFLHGQDYREKLPATLYLTKDTYLYPDNPPDRFIQIVGGENVPDVGFVCGYAAREEDGSPLLRKNRISRAGFLYTSSKTYPYAMDGGKIPVIRKVAMVKESRCKL